MSKINELSTRETIQEAINEIDFKEIIKVKAKEEAEKTIKEIIQDQFRWNGSIKKQLEEEFEKMDKIDLSSLGITGMAALMSESIINGVNELIANETKDVVQQHLYERLEGYSRLNSLDSMIKMVIDEQDKREYDTDGTPGGEITVRLLEERSYFGYDPEKIIEITHESDDEYHNETEKIRFKLWSDNSIWNLRADNLDVLQPLYSNLKKVEDFRLKLVEIKEDQYEYLDAYEELWVMHPKGEKVEHLGDGYVKYRPLVVHKETIGQYTGLKDINGKEIYTNDIVGGYRFYSDDTCYDEEIAKLTADYSFGSLIDMKVIGNIHENKDLLEGINLMDCTATNIFHKNNQDMLRRSTHRILNHCNSIMCTEEQKIIIMAVIHLALGPNYTHESIKQFDCFVVTIDGLDYPSLIVSIAEEFNLNISRCPKRNEIDFKEKLRRIFKRDRSINNE